MMRRTQSLSHGSATPDAAVHDVAACLYGLFEQQAESTSFALAVVDSERQITYRELRQRSQRLALRLRAEGVGPEVPVALFTGRCLEGIVGIVGILGAGGAYVPIDPHDSDERIRAILTSMAAPVALVQSHFAHRLRGMVGEVIEIEEYAAAPATPQERVVAGVTPDNLATIVYTSGTTGTPKGVEVPHSAIVARLRNGYLARPHDLQKAPLNVVGHFSDLLAPLLSGGPVIVAPDECLRSGRALRDVILRYRTTRMVFVPSQLSGLLESGGDAIVALRRLDTVIVSGEPLSPSLVSSFKRLLPSVALLNAYGASEVAGLACIGEVNSAEDIHVGSVIRGCTAYVLDDELRPVPALAPGEVFLGGAQMTRGYRGNAALTAERFIPDPFVGGAARMYRTGDVAERLVDGRLRILGRRDLEVKVHGWRVDLNEVETVLEHLPGIARAIATWHGDDGSGHLSAYVVGDGGREALDAGAVRAAAAAALPAYMVPSRLQFVNELPLLPNGKVDRRALLGYESEFLTSTQFHASAYAPLQTTTEHALAEIWRCLLGVQQVSGTDDFFTLGGDSLDALRFVLRAEESGFTVALEDVRLGRSLADLARMIDQHREREGGRPDGTGVGR